MIDVSTTRTNIAIASRIGSRRSAVGRLGHARDSSPRSRGRPPCDHRAVRCRASLASVRPSSPSPSPSRSMASYRTRSRRPEPAARRAGQLPDGGGRTATLSQRPPVARRTTNVLRERRLGRRHQLARRVVGLLGHRPGPVEAEAQAVLLAERVDQAHRDRRRTGSGRRWSCRSRSRPASRDLHLVQPVAMVDRRQDRRVAPQQGLVLELQVLGHRQDDLLGARPGDLVVPVGDVRADGDRGERRRVDLVRHAVERLVHVDRDDPAGGRARRRRCRRPARARAPA